jgi:carboxyl-terminal processing protease
MIVVGLLPGSGAGMNVEPDRSERDMMHISRTRRFLLVAALALVPSAGALTAANQGATGTLQRWSEEVWESALRGDAAAVERQFQRVPGDEMSVAARFRASLESYRTNIDQARVSQAESRERAQRELHAHLDGGDLSQALRSAVEIQTLSEDFDAAFDNPEVAAVIELAVSEIPQVKESGDWLRAQELLFRLRTLYDDTTRHEEYRRYDEQLEQVNHRVALLARYVPAKLHELRNRAAERLGEEPVEFNLGNAVDWRDRLNDIEPRMLSEAMRKAATEHIEGQGWRPLLEGGLEAMRIFGTTTMLADTFPRIGDNAAVDRWVAGIEQELAELHRTPDRELGNWTATRVRDRLIKLNDETLKLPEKVIYREFGDGAMHHLDPFSEIIWPDKLRRFRQATEGNFIGVGILIRHNEKREIVVVNPLEGTPAYFAGIKPDDTIVEVNNESTVGWSLNDAVDQITGPKGAPVTLTIRREGHEDLLNIRIVRDVIKINSVRGWWKERLAENGEPVWDWYIDPVSRIAYIRLTSFNDDTYRDLIEAWRQISADGRPNGLIVDLRFNPGGLLTSAVQVSNLFVRRGMIVSGERKDGTMAWDQRARPGAAELAGVPTVVLINKGSASGSEIVAGALQAHNAAVVIGERSFGKGSVQTVHNIATDRRGEVNAALKLTTQYYRLPPMPGQEKGNLVHRRPGSPIWGVEPDIRVTMTAAQLEEWDRIRRRADIINPNAPEDGMLDGDLDPDAQERPHINEVLTRGLDPQLEAALLILQAKAMGTLEAQQRHAMRGR